MRFGKRCSTEPRARDAPLFGVDHVADSPERFLADSGRVFARFDERTQDSGNVSYGVEIGGRRCFVKTAGRADTASFHDHADRVRLLRNAVHLAQSCEHRTLPKLRQVVESPRGPMLVYDWVDGELARSALNRVRALPASQVSRLLSDIYDLHVQLVGEGWVAVDFYDGAMIYDFDRRRVHAVDLDCYQRGRFTNTMGRMFGSTRFMAPEEFELGATIDERTTVFTLGRTAAELLSDGSLDRQPFGGSEAQHRVMIQSCRAHPDDRFQTVAEMNAAWLAAG